MKVICILLCLTKFTSGENQTTVKSNWKYVVPAAGNRDEHSPARAIRMTEQGATKGDFETAPSSKELRFGQVTYGTPNSVPVRVAVEHISDAKAVLYVDANRDGRFDHSERHELALSAEGQSQRVTISLDAHVFRTKDEPPARTPRTVYFWVGRAGKSARYATAGFLSGLSSIDGKQVAIRRFDMDGDGFVNGPHDTIAIDSDGNGDFDPFLERFAVSPILRLGGKRYSITANSDATDIKFTRLDAEGSLLCTGPKLAKGAEILDLSISLVGEDGTVAFLSEFGKPVVVPIGKYRVYQASIRVRDPAGAEPWYYQFAPEFTARRFAWHMVSKDSLTTLEPFASLTLSAKINDPPKDRSGPGESLQILTSFQSGDLLEAQICCRGNHWDNLKSCEAQIQLTCTTGEQFDVAKTGFN